MLVYICSVYANLLELDHLFLTVKKDVNITSVLQVRDPHSLFASAF